MTLSIVLPVYNVGKYLSSCIESILSQTFSDFELIIVNDGSTDDSLQIAETFANKDIRIKIITQHNLGLSAARNRGIDAAKGDYIAFVDSDDTIDTSMYARMIEVIKAYHAEIIVCGHRVLSEDNQLVSNVRYGSHILSGIEATKMILNDSILPSFAWDKVYKLSLFKDISYPSGRIYEDIATTYKLFNNASRVVIIDEIYYNYYRRQGSICLSKGLEREYKRNTDLYLSFKERFLFTNTNHQYTEMQSICAFTAFTAGKNLLHVMLRDKTGYAWVISANSIIKDLCKLYNYCSGSLTITSKLEVYLLKFMPAVYNVLLRLYFKIKY